MRGKCQAARDNPLAGGPGKPKGSKGGNQHTAAKYRGSTKSEQDRSNTYTLRRLARDNPEAKQQDIANEVGTSRQYVHEVLSSKNSQWEEILDAVPNHIEGNSSKADFRKLPAELREKVAAVSLSIHHKA